MSRNAMIYSCLLLMVAASAAFAQELPAAPPAPDAPPAAAAQNNPAVEAALNGAPDPKKTADELAYRAALGRGDDIKLLLREGADANGTNAEGVPLIIIAAGRKDQEALPALQALLEAGANVNAKDAGGQTALYAAARNGRADMVDYLLKNKIDYYSLDRNGDIARTIAYRAGHENIVTLMDEFVKRQTFQSQSLVLNAQQLQQQQLEEERKEAARRAAEEKRKAAENARKAKLERERQEREYQQKLERMEGLVYDISYNACAFEYWSFGLAANQTMAMPDEQVEETIAIHKSLAADASFEVMKMFSVGQQYVNKIINPSKAQIHNVLAAMPSRTYRKEHGFGTLDDVAKRCTRVAKNWEIKAPTKMTAEEKAEAAKEAATNAAAAKKLAEKKAQEARRQQAQKKVSTQSRKPQAFDDNVIIQKNPAMLR